MSRRDFGPIRMTLALAGAAVAIASQLTAAAMPAAAAPASRPVRYYLSLGDSLAHGVQPATPPLPPGVAAGQSIETNQGYAGIEAGYEVPGVGVL